MTLADARRVATLRCELAEAERDLLEKAEREAIRLARAEYVAWREAQEACFAYDWIRQNVNRRLEAIHAGEPEQSPGELQLTEMAFTDAARADAAYTVISFARLHDRLRYLRGGSEREAVVREALDQGGCLTSAEMGVGETSGKLQFPS
jgi:hypothetical protein